MITSNHKKLVQCCFPPSLKTALLLPPAAIQPEPNALGKLIYYCSTRPNKIHKIANYLLSYAQAQALPASFTASLSNCRHSKPGLICTLKIFQALLENCSAHLRFLASRLNAVIAIGLGLTNPNSISPSSPKGYFGADWVSQDLDITLASIHLFCQYARSIQFDCLQDRQLARNFLFFLAKFSSIAMVSPATGSILLQPSNSPRQSLLKPKSARCMALMALESAIQAPDMYSSTSFDRQIRMIIPGLTAAITPSALRDPDELLTLIHQARIKYPSSSSSPNELVQDIQRLRSIISPGTKPEKSSPTESDLINYSIKILNFLLSVQLTHLNHFETCINTILNQLASTMNSDKSSQFYDWFGQSLLYWTTPKHRSVVIDLVVDRLSSIQLGNRPEREIPEKASIDLAGRSSEPHDHQQQQVKNLTMFASMLKAMLRDPIACSIQLLNILHILHQTLRLIQSLLEETHTLKQEDIKHLLDLLVQVIGSLVYTVYYDQQINDICKDLLGRIRSLVTPASSSPKNSPVTRSIEPSFVVALFDCLDCILINSNNELNFYHLVAGSTKISTRPQPERPPVPIVLWKENLRILEDLQEEPQCRSAFYRALTSFVKFEAFSHHSNPDQVQQLVQFLSTLNIFFYRSFVGAALNHPGTTSTPRIGTLDANQSSPKDTMQPAYPRTTQSDVPPNSADLTGLKTCLLEIFKQQHHSSLLVCVPMLRELDGILTSLLSKNGHEDKALIIDCLEAIGKTWKIEKLDQKDFVIQVQREQKDGDEDNVTTTEVRWDTVIEEMCNSTILQEKSGTDQVNLKLHFGQRWTMHEAMNLSGVWSKSAVNVARRGSMRSYNSTLNQERTRDLTGTRSSPDLQGRGGQGSSGPPSRRISTTRAFRKSYLPNLFDESHRTSSHGFLLSTTSSSTTSVSDLRKSLLGVGFLPMGDRNTSSGHSSIFFNHNAATTHTNDPRDSSSSSGNLFINNSTGDLAQFAAGNRLSSLGTSIITGRQQQRFNEFGARQEPEQSCSSPISTTSHHQHLHSPTTDRDRDRDVLVQRKLTLDKRKTLTSQVLNKVRRSSLHSLSSSSASERNHHHHSQPIVIPPVPPLDFDNLPVSPIDPTSGSINHNLFSTNKTNHPSLLLNKHKDSALVNQPNFIINPPYQDS